MNGNKIQQSIYRSYARFTFDFERHFDIEANNEWMSQNWSQSFYWAIAYFIVIFGGKIWMRNREPYKLRSALSLWNLALAIFSTLGAIRTIPEIIDILREQGFAASVCNNRAMTEVQVSHTWIWLFALSKVPELVDTVFIVLRKQKLIFLHWYHHMSVVVYCWLCVSEQASFFRWNASINFAIHSIMYSYYAVRAMNIRLPKWIAILITSMQIIQMIYLIFVDLYALNLKFNGYNCMSSNWTIFWSLFTVTSYLILFINFFNHTYLKSSKEKELKKDQ